MCACVLCNESKQGTRQRGTVTALHPTALHITAEVILTSFLDLFHIMPFQVANLLPTREKTVPK